MLSSHRLHFHRPDSFAMMVHIEFFAYQIYLLYAIHQILAVQLSINQFLQSQSYEKADNLHHMQQLSYPQLNADEITIENCRAYKENYIYHEILLQNWKPD